MTIDKHAYEVVKSFKKSLNKNQVAALDAENFEELQMLIEAALGSTAETILHDTAKTLEKTAKKARKKAKSIQSLED